MPKVTLAGDNSFIFAILKHSISYHDVNKQFEYILPKSTITLIID